MNLDWGRVATRVGETGGTRGTTEDPAEEVLRKDLVISDGREERGVDGLSDLSHEGLQTSYRVVLLSSVFRPPGLRTVVCRTTCVPATPHRPVPTLRPSPPAPRSQ